MIARFLLSAILMIGIAVGSLGSPSLPAEVGVAAARTNTPTPTRTRTPTPTRTRTPTPSSTRTPTPSSTAVATGTPTAGATATLMPSATTTPISTMLATPTSVTSTPAAAPVSSGYLPLIVQAGTAPLASTPTSTITPIPSSTAAPSGRIPSFSHVFTIIMENEALEAILGNTSSAPYINSLAQKYGIAANYYGIGHPSLQNYIALIGGDTFGINSDCTDCFIDAPNLVDQLEGAGKTWKAYMESMPSPCFVGDDSPLYRQKHNPFIYFDNIRNNPARCAKIVPFSQFDQDLQAGTLPDYVWITPNMCNDIHDCSLATGDAWLQTWVSKIVNSPAWQQNGVLFLTFDESERSDTSGCCVYAAGGHILTLVISPLGKPTYQSQAAYGHYSLLRTVEEAWGLPFLSKAACDCSPPMADFFIAAPAGKRP